MSISSAFAELQRTHLARENWACCQTCGLAETSELAKSEPRYRYYCFYHMQDAEQLQRMGAVHVSYGGFYAGDDDDATVGREIAEVFRRHGCPVDWEGSAESRLLVWCDAPTRLQALLVGAGHEVATA